jgi:phosphate transport system protein
MAGLVEFGIHEGVLALTERDERRVQQVLRNEDRVNKLEMEIDEQATDLMARYQPMAKDIRFLTAAIKINHDLERMGDLAVNLSERAMSLIRQEPVKPNIDIPRMAQLVESMVHQSLDAFVRRDVALARNVLASDDAVDDIRDSSSRELISFMEKEPAAIARCLDLLFATRHLERVADHATNIAEDVLFLVEGIEVRHHSEVRELQG